MWKVSWRFVGLWKSLFSLFIFSAGDALLALLRVYGKDKQAEMVLWGELEELNLDGRPIGDDGAQIVADFLKHDETVHTMFLWNCNIGPRGAEAIAESLKHNQTVVDMEIQLETRVQRLFLML